MKNPSNAVRAAYYTKITGLTYGGAQIPMYDTIAPDAAEPGRDFMYVILTQVEASPFYSRQGNVNTVRVSLSVITGFAAEGGYKKSEEVADKIIEAIVLEAGQPFDLAASGFKCMLTRLENKSNNFQLTSTHRVYLTTLIFAHDIGQVS